MPCRQLVEVLVIYLKRVSIQTIGSVLSLLGTLPITHLSYPQACPALLNVALTHLSHPQACAALLAVAAGRIPTGISGLGGRAGCAAGGHRGPAAVEGARLGRELRCGGRRGGGTHPWRTSGKGDHILGNFGQASVKCRWRMQVFVPGNYSMEGPT